ncbi:MAG TPA: TetR/AcrR family transcriptional regulator [Actinomycetota bacterium]|nr:TetR/AcrR family transcriptional regulator [Actinomycetota bacterium]
MPRPNVAAQRREQILAATREVVAEKGFKAMRVADVARKAGTSTGTIHNYFETKRDLMRAAFEWNWHTSQARRIHLAQAGQDPRDRLRAILHSYLPDDEAVVQSWHMWIEFWSEALHDPSLQELNERVYGEWRRTLTAIIHDGQERGVFVAGDPVVLADGLVGMVDGLALQVLLGSQNMTVAGMAEVCDRAVDALLAEGN